MDDEFHPEEGIVNTVPAHKVKEAEIPKTSNSWKIASYVSFVVIAGLIVVNVIPRSSKKTDRENSIAVLPFRNESSDEENTYFINGTMEAIPVIAEELDVSYILEGTGQKIGNVAISISHE